MRLIDADSLRRRFESWNADLALTYGENDEYCQCLACVCEKIDAAPTIEPTIWKYCPKCGARMVNEL